MIKMTTADYDLLHGFVYCAWCRIKKKEKPSLNSTTQLATNHLVSIIVSSLYMIHSTSEASQVSYIYSLSTNEWIYQQSLFLRCLLWWFIPKPLVSLIESGPLSGDCCVLHVYQQQTTTCLFCFSFDLIWFVSGFLVFCLLGLKSTHHHHHRIIVHKLLVWNNVNEHLSLHLHMGVCLCVCASTSVTLSHR